MEQLQLGPYSVGGGEIKNSVLFGYSNKAHDGYLGDSVLGEWCNLGVGTSNSNLKNNVSVVQMYSPSETGNQDSGWQKMRIDYGRLRAQRHQYIL
jgi:NDP-sugar pyrophosphorylase family protein